MVASLRLLANEAEEQDDLSVDMLQVFFQLSDALEALAATFALEILAFLVHGVEPIQHGMELLNGQVRSATVDGSAASTAALFGAVDSLTDNLDAFVKSTDIVLIKFSSQLKVSVEFFKGQIEVNNVNSPHISGLFCAAVDNARIVNMNAHEEGSQIQLRIQGFENDGEVVKAVEGMHQLLAVGMA